MAGTAFRARTKRGWSRSRADCADFRGRLKNLPLAVSPETGHLLFMPACSTPAAPIVEFGAAFRLSTICLASVRRDNGGPLFAAFADGVALSIRL